MAEEVKKFNVYDENGTVLAEAKESPILVEGLKPQTKYSGWKISYTGMTVKTTIPDFTTQPIHLTNFTIDNLSPSGTVGGSVVLTASNFLPENASNKGLSVSVDDPSVATVEYHYNGTYTVKFIKAGETSIHWTANDGGGLKVDGKVTATAPAEPSAAPASSAPAESSAASSAAPAPSAG